MRVVDLRVEFDYLTMSTDDWLLSVGDPDDELSEELTAYGQGQDLTGEVVTQWLTEKFGKVTGIYGDGGPVTVTTVNEETFLDDDITFTFANTEDGDAYIIVHGHGYFLDSRAEVYRFTGTDDADAFSYVGGYAVHATDTDCETKDWIIENTVSLVPNGGVESYHIADSIKDEKLLCPKCGGELYAASY